jgi:hypothetical protein
MISSHFQPEVVSFQAIIPVRTRMFLRFIPAPHLACVARAKKPAAQPERHFDVNVWVED